MAKPKKTARAWRLPDEQDAAKLSGKLTGGLRKAMLRYIRNHRDQFPDLQPMRAASRLYARLFSEYENYASTGPWACNLRERSLPHVDVTPYEILCCAGGIPERKSRAAIDWQKRLPPGHRLVMPFRGMDEFVVLSVRDPATLGLEYTWVRLGPGNETISREGLPVVARSLEAVRYTRPNKETFQPTCAITGQLDACTDPGNPDSVSAWIERGRTLYMSDYCTLVPPGQLDWSDDDIMFWEEVVLYYYTAASMALKDTDADLNVLNEVGLAVSIAIHQACHNEPSETPESEREAARRANRPLYLKPDPDEDASGTWTFGLVTIRDKRLPELEPDLVPFKKEAMSKDDGTGLSGNGGTETAKENVAGDTENPDHDGTDETPDRDAGDTENPDHDRTDELPDDAACEGPES